MLAFLVVLITSAPLALKYLFSQLVDENYQFSLPYLACLVWIGWVRLKNVSYRVYRPLASDYVLVALVWFAATASIVLNLPKGGYISFILAITLGIKLLFDAHGFRAVLPVLLAAFVVVSPPFGLLEQITTSLQRMVVEVAHYTLLATNVLHRISGNIILLGDRPLLVAEACSGIRSLVSIISIGVCYCLYKEHSWMRSLTLFGISLVVVTILNLFRILFIVLTIQAYGIDFTMGIKHEILGLIGFLSGLLVILGTDNLLDGLRDFLAPKVILRNPSDSAPEIDLEPEYSELPHVKPSRVWPKLGTTGIALLVIFVPSLLLQARVLVREGTRFILPGEGIGHLELLSKRAHLDLDGWKSIQGPEIIEDERLAGTGVQSQFWLFKKGEMTVRIAIDEPFKDFHPLNFCYRFVGWDQKEFKESRSTDGKFRVEVHFFKPPNLRLFLIFAHVDRFGQWQVPNSTMGNYLDLIRQRLSETFIYSVNPATKHNYQIQMSCISRHDLTKQQENDLRDLFELFRNEIQKWPEFRHNINE